MFSNNVQSSEIFPGETKLLWKSTSKQNYIKKRRPSDFSFDILKTGQKETAKPSQFFAFLPLNKINTSKLRRFSIHQSRIKRHRNYINFLSIKSNLKKYIKTTPKFFPSKLHLKNYVKTTSIFLPSRLHWRKCFETTSNFYPSKLHWKRKPI